jgi:hypothetical protein
MIGEMSEVERGGERGGELRVLTEGEGRRGTR